VEVLADRTSGASRQKLPGINHTAKVEGQSRIQYEEGPAMKVSGTNGTSGAQAARPSRGAGGDGFRLSFPPPAAGPSSVSGATIAASVMGLDALLALQDVGGPLERRRRAVRRADRILDELDEMKMSLLEGDGVSTQNLERLRRAVAEQREGADDAHLQAVLDEVELRAAVEIAKLEQARRAT
jgi:hypothetical protein